MRCSTESMTWTGGYKTPDWDSPSVEPGIGAGAMFPFGCEASLADNGVAAAISGTGTGAGATSVTGWGATAAAIPLTPAVMAAAFPSFKIKAIRVKEKIDSLGLLDHWGCTSTSDVAFQNRLPLVVEGLLGSHCCFPSSPCLVLKSQLQPVFICCRKQLVHQS